MKILVIDNIDSFVYNIVQYIGEQGADPIVFKNTAEYAEVEETVGKERVKGVIISPGPKTPKEAGVSNDIIKNLGPQMPLLGVCLGHQCIGYTYGGKIRPAKTLRHGKTSLIDHDETGVLSGIKNPVEATRYHSLVVDKETLPECLYVNATSRDDKEIMAIKHKEHPIYGLQFHPESILTDDGKKIVKNFVNLVEKWNPKR